MKKTVNVRLSDKAIETIKLKALEEKRTFSGMVNAILEKWSEKKECNHIFEAVGENMQYAKCIKCNFKP